MKSAISYRTYRNADGLQVLLPETVWLQIQDQVIKFYPNECGGILVGHIDTETGSATIEQMLVPNGTLGTPVFFRRFAKGVNKLLSNLFESSEGDIRYVGEWHSHPNNVPKPSNTDLSTMLGIAANKNISIKTPLLLIVGYDREQFDEQFYITFNNKLINYERQ